MKKLPWIITDDEFFFATEQQRAEWNARIAMATDEANDNQPITGYDPVPGSWEETKQLWAEQRQRELDDDATADGLRGHWGE